MSYSPEYQGPIAGYVINHMKKNYWKVAATMPREDLLQEAYVVFLRCKRKYSHLEAPQHFMALFKTAWCHQFLDFANEDTASRCLVEMPRMRFSEGDDVEFEPQGDGDNDGALAIALDQAPSEVKAVLQLFLNAPAELLEIATASWKGNDKRCKAGGSKRINQLLGLPEELDVMQMTRDYFGGAT